MMYLNLFLLSLFFFTAIMMRIVKINTTNKTPTAPRMLDAPRKKGEGLLVSVTVVGSVTVIGSVTVLEDTDALMVPPTVVVMVGITAVIDEREAVDIAMMKTLNSIVF